MFRSGFVTVLHIRALQTNSVSSEDKFVIVGVGTKNNKCASSLGSWPDELLYGWKLWLKTVVWSLACNPQSSRISSDYPLNEDQVRFWHRSQSFTVFRSSRKISKVHKSPLSGRTNMLWLMLNGHGNFKVIIQSGNVLHFTTGCDQYVIRCLMLINRLLKWNKMQDELHWCLSDPLISSVVLMCIPVKASGCQKRFLWQQFPFFKMCKLTIRKCM